MTTRAPDVKVFTRTEGGYGISVSDEVVTHSTSVWPGDSDPVSPQFLFHALEQIAQLQAENAELITQVNGLCDGTAQLCRELEKTRAERDELKVWESFARYLVEKCEGAEITEEFMQQALAKMISEGEGK